MYIICAARGFAKTRSIVFRKPAPARRRCHIYTAHAIVYNNIIHSERRNTIYIYIHIMIYIIHNTLIHIVYI